jgi:23S rRNA U2552 (ribose-2'-O)-methylase RlmE/FtsJ
MIIMEITEEEVNTRIETFLQDIDKIISDHNGWWKFKDEAETIQMLNYLFHLSGSTLRVDWIDECIILHSKDDKLFKSTFEAYFNYLQFNNDVLKLPMIVKAFRKLYRHKKRYKKLWMGWSE